MPLSSHDQLTKLIKPKGGSIHICNHRNNDKPVNKGSLFTKGDGSLWRQNNICLFNVCLFSFCLGSKAHFCDVTQWSINFPGWKGFFNSFLTQETVHELVKCDHSNELLWELGSHPALLSSGKILKCPDIQESHWTVFPARVLFIMLYWQEVMTVKYIVIALSKQSFIE